VQIEQPALSWQLGEEANKVSEPFLVAKEFFLKMWILVEKLVNTSLECAISILSLVNYNLSAILCFVSPRVADVSVTRFRNCIIEKKLKKENNVPGSLGMKVNECIVMMKHPNQKSQIKWNFFLHFLIARLVLKLFI